VIVAWHGWRIEVPDRWSPVKVDGDAEQGSLLMADLHRPRLGLRWKKMSGRKFDAQAAVAKAMTDEVGTLAKNEAVAQGPEGGNWSAPLLFVDKEPPGRDVWCAYGASSGRLVEVVYHARRRDSVLAGRLLPTLSEAQAGGEQEWSIFELSCKTPPGLKLVKQRLNAGDLSLMFEGGKKQAVSVRQIAVAKLALQRRSMDRWIAEQVSWRGKYFKVHGSVSEVQETPKLIRQQAVRRRRYSWMWWLASGFVALAKHDEARDRLVIVDATDEGLARQIMDSVGWAKAI
jgi:hypothetical protein